MKTMPISKISSRKPIIIAHRGASAIAPENTMPAMQAALDAQADGIEFDVQRTTDGALVVFHDDDLDRTSNGTGNIKDHSWEDLQKLDAGKWFDEKFAGTKIPRLEEFFDWMKNNEMLMFLELKSPWNYEGMGKSVADLIHQYEFGERVQVRSFYHDALHEFHRLAPEIAISELWYQHMPSEDEITYATLNLEGSRYTQENIQAYHDLGYSVTAWTVDDLELAKNLKNWGIDGITTNDPAKMMTIFET